MRLQNRALGLALEREKQKAAGVSAELQKTKLIGTVPQAGSTDPQVCNAPLAVVSMSQSQRYKSSTRVKHHSKRLEGVSASGACLTVPAEQLCSLWTLGSPV